MTTSTDRTQYREVLASLSTKTKAKIPELNGRVEKAVRLALAGDVELHDNGATVYSSSDPTRRYEIIDGMCPCRDWEQAPQHLCQHRLAAGFSRKVRELLLPAPEPTPAAGPHGLPEAPASANVRIHLHGHEVQVTLRDHTEVRLMARMEELLQHYAAAPAPPPPAARPVQGQGWCSTHGVQMTLNTKNGNTWYSHRKPEGGFCKGR